MNPQDVVPLMIFEWIKGEKSGNTEIVKEVKTRGEFTRIEFEGGNRINGNVLDEFMILIGMAEADDVKKHQAYDNNEVYEEPPITAENGLSTPTRKVEVVDDFYLSIFTKAKHDTKVLLDFVIDIDFIDEDKISTLLELYGDDLYTNLRGYLRNLISDDILNSCIDKYLETKYSKYTPKKEEEVSEEAEIVDIDND